MPDKICESQTRTIFKNISERAVTAIPRFHRCTIRYFDWEPGWGESVRIRGCDADSDAGVIVGKHDIFTPEVIGVPRLSRNESEM